MKAKVQFIGALAMINAYLMAFAYGFNSHPVLVVDPSLPPLASENKTKLPQSQPAKTAGEAGTAKNEAKSRKRSKESSKADKARTSKKAPQSAKIGKAKHKKGSPQAD